MSKAYARGASSATTPALIIAIDAIDGRFADLSRTATRSTRSRSSCTANSYRRPDSLTSSRSPLTGTWDTLAVRHAWTMSTQRPSYGLQGRALVRAGGRKRPQSSGKRWVSDPVYAATMAPRQIRESRTGACQKDSRTPPRFSALTNRRTRQTRQSISPPKSTYAVLSERNGLSSRRWRPVKYASTPARARFSLSHMPTRPALCRGVSGMSPRSAPAPSRE